jgi:hypothetical protein
MILLSIFLGFGLFFSAACGVKGDPIPYVRAYPSADEKKIDPAPALPTVNAPVEGGK